MQILSFSSSYLSYCFSLYLVSEECFTDRICETTRTTTITFVKKKTKQIVEYTFRKFSEIKLRRIDCFYAFWCHVFDVSCHHNLSGFKFKLKLSIGLVDLQLRRKLANNFTSKIFGCLNNDLLDVKSRVRAPGQTSK